MMTFLRRVFVITRPMLTRRFVYGYIYSLVRDLVPIKKQHVLLESFHGKAFWDSPYALLKHMASQQDFRDWTFVVVAPHKQRQQLREAFSHCQLRFVQPKSVQYVWYLATCKWLINDVTFPLYFSRRLEQKYLNTWHGTPLKTLGRDIKGSLVSQLSNVQRNFLHATHLLTPNSHTETVLREAYMLDGRFEGNVIQCGYPRNDVLVNAPQKGLSQENLQVAFMPTWRGTLDTRSKDSREQLANLGNLLAKLDASLRSDITFWVKLHPLVAGQLDLAGYRRIRAFPANVSPYEHLAGCDVLITDYSSVLFDFALTLRPIVLYVPDEEKYRDERGFYIAPDSLPLPRIHTADALVEMINQIDAQPASTLEEYQEFFRAYGAWEHGDSCERICNTFFAQPEKMKRAPVVSWQSTPLRKRVLLYTGAMQPNGITRSFMTLISMIDAKDIDYTILSDINFDPDGTEDFLRSSAGNIGFIPLSLNIYIGPLELLRVIWLYLFKRNMQETPRVLIRIWERENRRLFADSPFDAFVNFNGYSWRAALLALGSKWQRIIYVHNDMAMEVDAGKLLDNRLLELSYRTADSVALVREGVEKEYCQRFYDYREKARYVPNCLRSDVSVKAEEPLANALVAQSPPGLLERLESMLAKEGTYRFINLARFSLEKGQARLIEAFEKVHAVHPDTQLFIVGGYGPLLSDIQLKATQSSAHDSICVVQGSTNPFPLAKRCNTMVFSSFYEGIGLVLFESLQLGLRVVSTDIPGPKEFLKQGYGLIVDNSVEGLVEGMEAGLSGRIPSLKFDLDTHNRVALHSFKSLFTLEEQCLKTLTCLSEKK